MTTGVKKIISGGQTGADRTGLEVGRELGLETGGTAPTKFQIDGGYDPSLADFGLIEHDSWAYPPRTKRNVLDADGTVLFGRMTAPGCGLTISFCAEAKKPWIDNPTPDQLRDWIAENGIEVLNVAGNRARTNPDIISLTRRTLLEALS